MKIKRNMLESKREYSIVFFEGRDGIVIKTKLANIFDDSDDVEWKYAVQEEIDAVLDLDINETLKMTFNRDDDESIGIIKRIN